MYLQTFVALKVAKFFLFTFHFFPRTVPEQVTFLGLLIEANSDLIDSLIALDSFACPLTNPLTVNVEVLSGVTCGEEPPLGGVLVGVAVAAVEAEDVPAVLVAVTVNEYSVPFVSPEISQ